MQSSQDRPGRNRLRVGLISFPLSVALALAVSAHAAGAAQAPETFDHANQGAEGPRAPSDGWIVIADHDRDSYKRKKYKHRKRKKFKQRPVVLVDPYPGHPPPLHLADSHCSSDLIGTLLGAAAGGLIGSQIGDGTGQMAAVGAGVFLGAILGGNLGAQVDAHDRNCMAHTLTQVPDHQQVVWQNPDSGQDYAVTPTRTFNVRDGRYCREYTAESIIGGQVQQTYGTACRQPDGAWEIVN